jgi:hypothetical protein
VVEKYVLDSAYPHDSCWISLCSRPAGLETRWEPIQMLVKEWQNELETHVVQISDKLCQSFAPQAGNSILILVTMVEGAERFVEAGQCPVETIVFS